jgi:hypothetical protein
LRYIEMDDFSSLMAEDEQGVENLKLGSYDNEHVDGGGVVHVIVQERAPGRGVDLGPPWKISANRGLAHVDAELEQLAVDAGRAPKRVGQAHLRISSRISRLILGRPSHGLLDF